MPDGKQESPGFTEALAVAEFQDTVIRSWESGRWEGVKSLRGQGELTNWFAVLIAILLFNAPVTAFDDTPIPVITAENASQIVELARFGGGNITTSRWSPNGEVLAVGSSLNIRLYRAGEDDPQVLPETGFTTGLTFNLDGSLLASSHQGSVYVWDVASGHQIGAWGSDNSGGIVTDLQFIPNSNLLAIANVNLSESGAPMASGLWMWDYDSQQVGTVIPGVGHWGGAPIAFNADTTLFVTTLNSSQTGSGLPVSIVQIRDSETGEPTYQMGSINPPVVEFLFSPTDSDLLASLDRRGVVRFWDAAKGFEVFALTLPYDVISAIAFSPDGTQLATGGTDGKVRVWDVASGAMLDVYTGQLAGISQLEYTQDGDILAFGMAEGIAHAWNVRTLVEINTFPLEGYTPKLVNVSFTSDGSGVIGLGADATIRFWDVATRQETAVWCGANFSTESTAISPNGRLIAYFDDESGELYLWDVEAGESPAIFQREPVSWIEGLAFNADSSLLAISTFGNARFSTDHAGVIRRWQIADNLDMSTDEVLLSEPGISARGLAVSPAQSLLAYELGEQIYLRQLATNEFTILPRQHNDLFANYSPLMTFSPDGRLLALQWEGSSVEFWDLASHTQVQQFYLYASGNEMAFSPDGSLMMVNRGWDVRLYNVNIGAGLAILRGHTAEITHAAFNAAGTLIVTSSLDGTLRLWGIG